jgi:hypothetical protein
MFLGLMVELLFCHEAGEKASAFSCIGFRKVHLITVLKFRMRRQNPVCPDRRNALSYLGGKAAAKQGSASRLPLR